MLPPFGEIVFPLQFGKTSIISYFCPLLFVFLLKSFFYSIVKDLLSLNLPLSFGSGIYPRFHVKFSGFGRRLCRLVGLDGLEPSTSRLSGARSNHLSYRPFLLKGTDSNHLSPYSFCSHSSLHPSCDGLRLSCVLPRVLAVGTADLVEMMGIEPMTPCLQGRCSPS